VLNPLALIRERAAASGRGNAGDCPNPQPSITAGLIGGLSVAKISGDPVERAFEWRTQFVVGAFGRLQFTDAIGLQPELLFNVLGGHRLNFFSQVDTLTLNYIQVPVLLHLSTEGRGDPRVFAVAGPAFGMRLMGAEFDTYQKSFDRSDEFEKRDISVVLGIGAEISRVIAELRYTIGVVNILTAVGRAETGLDAGRNRSVQLMGGVKVFGSRRRTLIGRPSR
jgi:hypothetical protein